MHADAEADVPVKRHPIQVKISMGFLRQAVLSQGAVAVFLPKKAAIPLAILSLASTLTRLPTIIRNNTENSI